MTHVVPDERMPSLRGADWLARGETQAVFAAIAAAGHEARAVGGAVRNALLGRPVGDVDIATSAAPDEVMRACEQAGLRCIPTGVDHGTTTVVSGGRTYEVTTLRQDVETYGRRAKIAFTDDWSADARRRDFTINALYCTREGTIVDPLGGYADLEARSVRFIGNAEDRIREDYLRILRFFRLHAEYGAGPADSVALAACVRQRAGLDGLSAERVRSELVKLLTAPGVIAAIDPMSSRGLLSQILGVAPRPGLLARLVATEAAHTSVPDAMLRLSVLAVAVEEDAARLGERLRLSNAERDSLIVADHRLARLIHLDERLARRALYRAGAERWRRLSLAAAALGQADATAARRLVELPQTWPVPSFALGGADVIALGIDPGPAVGELLRDLEDWWIAGDFTADEAALRMRLAEAVHKRKA